MIWNKARLSKQERMESVRNMISGKVIDSAKIVNFLETIIHSEDKVVLEGCNQKQAPFLADALNAVDIKKLNNLHMIMPAIALPQHLTLFEKGVGRILDFAYCGGLAESLAATFKSGKMELGSIHTYMELYSRLFLDLTPNVCLVAADKADRNGNLYTGFNTEETPTIVEATAFKDGIVIVQANEIVDEKDLPRIDIPGDWIDFIVQADKPYNLDPLFTRDPEKIKDENVLMGMMVIKGIYAKHNVKSLNHGLGYNTAAIELLLPTYGNQLGLKGKICTHWVLNPHPTLIPAIEDGWVKQIMAFGGEPGMEKYTMARPDIFFTGKDGSLRSNRMMAQNAGLYAMDLFIGSTLEMDYYGNSSTVTGPRLNGFGGAPNMGNAAGGRRHLTQAWTEMAPGGDSLIAGKKLVVQMLKSKSKFGPAFLPELSAVKIGKDNGMAAPPVMIYGEDVTHTVSEQGIAYLYNARTPQERMKMLAAIAQGTPLGEKITAEEIADLRKKGFVAYPEDLQIDRAQATRDLLVAKNLDDLVKISGGLYKIPEKFKKA